MSKRLGCLLVFLTLVTASALSAADVALIIRGEVKTPLAISLAEIKSFPAISVTAREHNGGTASYEGVPLAELLSPAGVPQGEALRGAALQLAVIVKAADGYKAVFALAELDPAMHDKKIILTFRRNGTDLDSAAGPLRIVVPDEKRQARWVRQVTELEVVRVGMSGKPASTQQNQHP